MFERSDRSKIALTGCAKRLFFGIVTYLLASTHAWAACGDHTQFTLKVVNNSNRAIYWMWLPVVNIADGSNFNNPQDSGNLARGQSQQFSFCFTGQQGAQSSFEATGLNGVNILYEQQGKQGVSSGPSPDFYYNIFANNDSNMPAGTFFFFGNGQQFSPQGKNCYGTVCITGTATCDGQSNMNLAKCIHGLTLNYTLTVSADNGVSTEVTAPLPSGKS